MCYISVYLQQNITYYKQRLFEEKKKFFEYLINLKYLICLHNIMSVFFKKFEFIYEQLWYIHL